MNWSLAIVGALLLAFGCYGIPGPKTGPGTEMPCGALRVSCYPIDHTHTCCPEHTYCNAWNGCDSDVPIGELSRRKPLKRTPEGEP